jgi:hypothetical protein
MANETNAAQASSIGTAELKGNVKMADSFMTDIYSLKLEEINQAFRKYMRAIKWVYLGDTDLIDKKTFVQPLQ